jgi:tRNA dimethylallyltransferase
LAAAKLRIICGPTAAGKSAIALDLAERYDAGIISADSRQIYRGFDVGTAKPRHEERARAPHLGVDVADPTERYSAARWAREAETWMEASLSLGKTPVIVGGTGLYIKALVEPLFAAPELDPIRREQLARELESKPVAELRRWCSELDAARAHLGRTQLVRAIETALLAGSRISDLHTAHAGRARRDEPTLQPTYLVVDPGDSLAPRIEARVEKMIADGWLDEVAGLARTVPSDAPAWKASGYSMMRQHIEGALDLSTARQRVIIETRQYAKRQRTWFRNQLPPAAVTHVNPDDSQARSIVREWWERSE